MWNMSPTKLVTRGPGATSFTWAMANQINITQQKVLTLFLGMLETRADPQFISVMICIKKSTVMNVQGYSLVLIVYDNNNNDNRQILIKKASSLIISFWLRWAKRRNSSFFYVSLPLAGVCLGSRSTGLVGGPHCGAYRTGKPLSRLQRWKTHSLN